MVRKVMDRRKTKEAEELLTKANPEDAELLNSFWIQYKKMNNRWIFCGISEKDSGDEDREDDDIVIVPFTSVFGGWTAFKKGVEFYNVIGSSGDINVDTSSWLGLMRVAYRVQGLDLTKLDTCCADSTTFYLNQNQQREQFTVYCTNYIVGGHITDDPYGLYNEMENFSPDIYLLPICSEHNCRNGIIMKCNKDIVAVHLMGYVN